VDADRLPAGAGPLSSSMQLTLFGDASPWQHVAMGDDERGGIKNDSHRHWRRRVEEFVLGHIAEPSARVLEVGCGNGDLARALDNAGHVVTAIDPRAPEGRLFRPVRFEEFSDPGPFDYVVSSLALHHIEDLEATVDKIADVLRPQGSLILVEFAWDRFDDATAGWALDRLPDTAEDPSWLQRMLGEWDRAKEVDDASIEVFCARWADAERLHSSRRMLTELSRRFHERLHEWTPYLYPELAGRVSEADEHAAIRARFINAIGFRYVGALRKVVASHAR
jgi:SAM-dependent methyltransferase